jgi:hypothetical protein
VAGRIENLRPWPRGVSDNPGGRPRKRPISDEIERLLQGEAPNASGKTYATALAEVLLNQALKGDLRAIAEVANRVEGKPLQAVDLDVSPHQDLESLTDDEIEARIEEIKRELGWPSESPAQGE